MRRMFVGEGGDGHSIRMGDGGGLLPALSGENVPGVQVGRPCPSTCNVGQSHQKQRQSGKLN